MSDNTFNIDKITVNDLSLDEIYARLNFCETSAGDEYLYERLTNPYLNKSDELTEFSIMMDELSESEALSAAAADYLSHIGKLKKYDFKDTLNELAASDKESNLSHIITDILIAAAFIFIFILPGPGVVAFIALIAYSVSAYFKKKNIIAGKLYVFSYIIKMLRSKLPEYNAVCIEKDNKTVLPGNGAYGECPGASVINKRFETINEIKRKFRPFMAGTFIISESAKTNSNPVGILLDYVRMIFHVDIIKYNSMINFIKDNSALAEKLYDTIGELDCVISLNKSLCGKKICRAEIGGSASFEVKGIYHPLIEKPVTNSISCERNILITGCNASGKSTFLKSVAINAIFAQSFGIAFAEYYKAPFYKIYSSMALRDDITGNQSYFMAEIKSLKRIIDEKDRGGDVPVLCVIDEVLRGTNTVERIAASAEILMSLTGDNILCLAATHDIELTELLDGEYLNYHFTEEITASDVYFNYKIKEGKATSRNAIRLLALLGYDEKLTAAATKRADDFVNTGKWQ